MKKENGKVEENQMPVDRFSGVGSSEKAMAMYAEEFKRAIQKNKWAVNIGGRNHLVIEAWQYMGQRVGLVAGTESCDAITEAGIYVGHQAKAVVRRIATGEIVATAVQECRANEINRRRDGTVHERWMDERGNPIVHAISGMAQTRAQSRALASAIRFLATLAGFSGTPAEEMPPSGEAQTPGKNPVDKVKENLAAGEGVPPANNGAKITEPQVGRLKAILYAGAKDKLEREKREMSYKDHIFQLGIEHTSDIAKGKQYESICEFADQIAKGMIPADG